MTKTILITGITGFIENRLCFYPMHTLPPYRELCQKDHFPIAERIAQRGINLPTWVGLTKEDVLFVYHNLLECLSGAEPL